MLRPGSTHIDSPVRSLIGLAVVAVLIASALPTSLASLGARANEVPQQAEDIRQLAPGSMIEREISGGETHTYRITLATGQFFQGGLQQTGLEVVMSLVGSDGQNLGEFDEPIGENAKRKILFIAKSDGEFRLIVRRPKNDAPLARYQILVEAVRYATEEDQMRVRATQLVKEARYVYWKVTPFSKDELRRFGEKFEEAMQLWKSLNDSWMVGETLLDLGITYGKMGEFTRALEFYQEALPLFPATAEGEASKATNLNNMADLYYRLGETRKSLDCYLESLKLKKAGRSRAITLDNIGGVFRRLGEYQQALEHHQQALTIFRALKKPRDEAVALNNTATLLGSIGDFDRSLEYLFQALELIRQIGDKNEETVYLYNIGGYYFNIGQYRQAFEYADQTVNLAIAINNRRTQADGLTLMCKVNHALGDDEQALNSCNRALPMHRTSGDRPTEAITLLTLGQIYQQTGDRQKVSESLESALALFRAVSDPVGELNTLHELGRLAMDGGDLDSARSQIERAIEMTESLRVKVGSHQLRSTYMAGLQRVYESYVDVLMQLHGRDPGKRYEQAALQFSERGRARSLLDLLAESRVQIRRGADLSLLEKESSLLQRLNDKDSALRRLRNNERTKGQADALAREINELTTQLQVVEAQVRSSSPRYAELTQPQSLTHEEIQRQLLDENTVLLEFALGKKQSWLWAVTSADTKTYRLPARREIEMAARRVYQLLIARQPKKGETEAERQMRIAEADGKFSQEAGALSRMLLEPIAASLRQEWNGKRLLFIAGGALEYLPFAALPLPWEKTYQPLIANHEVVNLPSASVLAEIRREDAGRQPAAKSLAVLADPVFELSDPRVLAATRKKKKRQSDILVANVRSADETSPASPPAANSELMQAVRSFDRTGFSRLPFSRDEAEAIAKFVPKSSLLQATDFQANRAMAVGPELGSYRIIHFATHGLLNSERPELSGLVLSLVDENGKTQDGFLRMHEIFNLQLPAEVIVLSACQTALGKEIKGEGLVGLTRGFMYAGAQRVVASLWQVDDLATAQLMKHFYRGMLKDGMRPAAALRAAQIEMIKQNRWSSPYFWSAFVIQGEWK
jgi:CHAT domain-containing protein/Tfp pilus assembly protein PilF